MLKLIRAVKVSTKNFDLKRHGKFQVLIMTLSSKCLKLEKSMLIFASDSIMVGRIMERRMIMELVLEYENMINSSYLRSIIESFNYKRRKNSPLYCLSFTQNDNMFICKCFRFLSGFIGRRIERWHYLINYVSVYSVNIFHVINFSYFSNNLIRE